MKVEISLRVNTPFKFINLLNRSTLEKRRIYDFFIGSLYRFVNILGNA